MAQEKTLPLKEWPDWLLELRPGMDLLLGAIDRHREDLQRACSSNYVYRRLGQAQIREFEALASERGALGVNKQLKYDVLKRSPVPPALMRAAVYNVGQRHHTVKAYLYAKKVFLLKLMAEMPAAFQTGNLFGGFAAIRATIESIADLCRFAASLADVKESSDARWMGMQLDDLINNEYSSRVDWGKMTSADLRQVEDLSRYRTQARGKDIVYDPTQAVRSLNKRVRGAQAVYEVLLELSQPRVGTLWLVYEESKTVPDRFKTYWNRNQLGIGFPRTVAEQMRPIMVQIFDVLYDCLPVMKQLDKEFADIDAKMLRVTQDEIRTMLWQFPDLFDKHEDCPCASGKRVKYCCGSG
jgi:hypothetical protein